MAEFKDVIKQQKRMCQTVEDCNKCPLRSMGYDCRFMVMIDADYDEAEVETIERIVMDWAVKHPEPRYPSWNRWFRETFPDSIYETSPCPNTFCRVCDPTAYHGEVECYECKGKPIPADIAKKLGIKLIGGTDNG